MRVNTVKEYLNQFEGPAREWLELFVAHMRETYPQLKEVISYQIPMYRFGKR